MRLSDTAPQEYDFERVDLTFIEGQVANLFSLKNNKTLGQTVDHPRYIKLRSEVFSRYASDLNQPLGEFLLHLKLRGDGSF